MRGLDKVSDVHGHLLDLGAVELFDLAHHAHVVGSNEVDGNTLTTETTTTTDAVDVVLAIGGEIVVDDKRNLLDIDTTSKEIGGDQDTRRSGTELLHDQITLSLVHVTVHGRDGEISGGELISKPVDLATGVAEDDSLGDGDSLVEIREGIELPLLLLHGNVELLDTLKGKLILLDQDTDGVTHELGSDLEDVLGHGGRKEDDLSRLGKQLEDIVDLLSETTLKAKKVSTRIQQNAKEFGAQSRITYRKHLVGLIQDEHLHAISLKETALNHVMDTAGGADNDLGAILQSLHIITNAGSANAGVALDVHEVANSNDDLLDLLRKFTGGSEDERLARLEAGVDLLEDRDREGGGLASTRLGLGDNIVTWKQARSATKLETTMGDPSYP